MSDQLTDTVPKDDIKAAYKDGVLTVNGRRIRVRNRAPLARLVTQGETLA